MTITIQRGNWDAVGLANYLTQQMELFGLNNSVIYNPYKLAFDFLHPVDIYPPTSVKMLSVLGFPTPIISSWTINEVQSSSIPIKLSGPACIHVNTNLPLFNVPVSGRLATVGVKVNYGELLLYEDQPASQPAFLTSQYLDKITIHLTDENNEELDGYDDIPWSAVISIDPVENSGFQQMTLERPNVEDTRNYQV